MLATRVKGVIQEVRNWTRGARLYDGRSGAIFQGIDIESKRTVVVKSTPLLNNSIAVRSLINERNILRKLMQCPNVIQYLGTSASDHVKEFGNGQAINLFLEYMPKGDLTRLLLSSEGHKLSEGVCKSYTRDLLHALSYMHAIGVVHGNVNGSNVLVGDRSVKLCDFGLARNVQAKIPVWMEDQCTQLEHRYKAPENFVHKHKLGPPLDVFSLGSLVCEMITGRRARLHDLGHEETEFQNPKQLQLLTNLIVEIPKDGWEGKPLARDFVAKCLIKEPKSRWTCDQLHKHPWIADVDDLQVVVNMNRIDSVQFWSQC